MDELAGSHDLAQVRAVTEDELRVATEELGRSTEHIARQTETLRQQHDAVSRMAKKQAETAAQREELERVQRRQNEQERHQLTMEVSAKRLAGMMKTDALVKKDPRWRICREKST